LGVEGRRKKEIMPTRAENNPSYMEAIEHCNKMTDDFKTYENEDPGPSRPSANAFHVLDCSGKQPREDARELG
jgi:hypothetical protein